MIVCSPFLLFIFILPTLAFSYQQVPVPSGKETLPEFNPEKCGIDLVVCILPPTVGNGLIKFNINHPAHRFVPRGVQVMIRSFNRWKILVEIWADEPNVAVKDPKDSVIFGCRWTDGEAEAFSDRSGTDVNVIGGGRTTSGKYYCRLEMKSWFETLDKNRPEIIKIVTGSATFEGSGFGDVKIHESCDRDWIGDSSSIKKEGFIFTDISIERKFAKPITCPEDSMITFFHKRELVEATQIRCDYHTGYHYAATHSNGSITNITGEFEAGCRYRECDLCPAPVFQCQHDGCELVEEAKVNECSVFQCPSSQMYINSGSEIHEGVIKCTKLESGHYDWTFDGVLVELASCKELPEKTPWWIYALFALGVVAVVILLASVPAAIWRCCKGYRSANG